MKQPKSINQSTEIGETQYIFVRYHCHTFLLQVLALLCWQSPALCPYTTLLSLHTALISSLRRCNRKFHGSIAMKHGVHVIAETALRMIHFKILGTAQDWNVVSSKIYSICE